MLRCFGATSKACLTEGASLSAIRASRIAAPVQARAAAVRSGDTCMVQAIGRAKSAAICASQTPNLIRQIRENYQ